MAEVRFRDRSARDLRLRLYEGEVDRSGLRSFARGRAEAGGVRVEAAVIGSSHWMEVRSDGLRVTELLACHEAPDGRQRAVWSPGERPLHVTVREGVRYRFAASVDPLPGASDDLARLRESVGLAALVPCELGLSFEYPGPGPGRVTSETLVWAAVEEDGVLARTAHAYPSEGVVVLSSTEIRLAARPRRLGGAELPASVRV